MHIVTDRGADLAEEQLAGLTIHYAPLKLTLDGKTYISGVDITPDEFYRLMDATSSFPTTSQPSSGDFAALYRELAKDGDEILSVHISSGLSGSLNSARAGALQVPEARVSFWDTRWLSCPEGWQVEAAARAAKAGWSMEKTLAFLEKVRSQTFGVFTLDTLRYLIHGGRISHIKGLLASLLKIRPLITVDQETCKYTSLAQERTMHKALEKMVSIARGRYGEGTRQRLQLIHGYNPEALEVLRSLLEKTFDCAWLPTVSVAPVLGAHTGPTLAAFCIAPQELFSVFD